MIAHVSNYSMFLVQPTSGSSRIATNFQAILTVAASSTGETEKIEPERTIDTVKREFYEYLDSLVLSPGLASSSISVTITNSAFEKMQADPEYMQKMKDLCARDLCDPRWTELAAQGIAPSASVITIDADAEEEYLASSCNQSEDRSQANRNDFWNRRKEKNKEMRDLQKEIAEEKREMMEFLQERADNRRRQFQAIVPFGGTTDRAAVSSVSSAAIPCEGIMV